MFSKILVANRGEIACRVIRTANRMGIRTVAVYSEADKDAAHVHMADTAYPIGGAAASDSYLKISTIVDVARSTGADAIHPGYGFLSENAEFALSCADAGVIFIGPSPDAIRKMGSKNEAKRLMEQANVPIVPGFHQDNLDLKIIATEARKIGYPVLIKASAGGGGRGMRLVEHELDLSESVKSARREAESAFGDGRILMEKYLVGPRHIEVQIFADNQGNCVHLFERDCSIQRRHQKVIEEAPGPSVGSDLRAKLGDIAVKAAKAIDYVGAGTVEFIVDRDGNPFFMEMNTRLQVEHPVTELITGQDLVEWQIRVASGEPLPRRSQEQLAIRGHAIEARLYAEDPRNNFMPSTGNLSRLVFPSSNDGVRVDSGVRQGDTVSPYYDPMIAKVICWGNDRGAALRGLARALSQVQAVGVTTNLELLLAILRDGAFADNAFDTDYTDRELSRLLPERRAARDPEYALAALFLLLERDDLAQQERSKTGDPTSPWGSLKAWRMNQAATDVLILRDNAANEDFHVQVAFLADGYRLALPGGEMVVSGSIDNQGNLLASLGGARITASVVRSNDIVSTIIRGDIRQFTVVNPLSAEEISASDDGRLTAPMPGKIIEISVEEGVSVERGTPLLKMEAMKIEHTISAPSDGRVSKLNYTIDDWVDEGTVLLDFVPKEA